jgi:predicted GIY-YIG superfamily endonuclease
MHCTDPAAGIVYLIHFDAAYKHARHYTGWTEDLDARLRRHHAGHGARLLEVITAAGITWRLARTWPGGRDLERAIKDQHNAPAFCPECTPRPRSIDIIWHATTTALRLPPAPARPPRLTPGQTGTRTGELFLSQRTGWDADRLLASYHFVTGPYQDASQHTPAAEEEHRAFAAVITGWIAQLRALDHGSQAGTR